MSPKPTYEELEQRVFELEKSYKNLKQSEERYRTIFFNSPIGIFRSTFEGRFIEVNPALARILGYDSPEEVIRSIHSIAEQIYVRSEKRQHIVSDQLTLEGISHHLNRYRRPDGNEMLMQCRTQLFKDESGSPVGMIGIATDITAQKATENALQESQKKYQQLVELSPNLIAVHRNGIFIFINKAGAKLLGADTPEQIAGKSVVEFISPSRRDLSLDRLKRLMENGDQSKVYEQKIRRLDGQERLVEVAGIPFPIEGENCGESRS